MQLEDDLSIGDRQHEFRKYVLSLRALQFDVRSVMSLLELLLSGIGGDRLVKIKADYTEVENIHAVVVALREEAARFVDYYDVIPRPSEEPPRNPISFTKEMNDFKVQARYVITRVRDVYGF